MKHEPHSFTRSICNIAYCAKCGLLALNNDFTRWCIKQGCNHEEHPEYQNIRIRYTRRM